MVAYFSIDRQRAHGSLLILTFTSSVRGKIQNANETALWALARLQEHHQVRTARERLPFSRLVCKPFERRPQISGTLHFISRDVRSHARCSVFRHASTIDSKIFM